MIERCIEQILRCCALITVLVTVVVFYSLVVDAYPFFREVSVGQLLCDVAWTPLFSVKHFGIWPLLFGTLMTTLIALAVALPTGLLIALFLSQYASERVRRSVKPLLEVLAGIPTIVYGYFALFTLTPALQAFFRAVLALDLPAFSGLSAGIVMGLMIVPMIASLCEDALYAVPESYKEASYALGADRFITMCRITLPAATGGIFAATMLAVSRALGETMIVAIAAGQEARFTVNPLSPVQTMTAFIAQVAMGDAPHGTLEYRTIFAVALILFILTLSLNTLAIRLRR
jgi:phosphate transport system permease protein